MEIFDAPFSNPGASILVSAPGSNIDSTSRELISDNGSTFGSDYTTSEGTSFATPIVSGVIALMLEANPNLGPGPQLKHWVHLTPSLTAIGLQHGRRPRLRQASRR